MRGMGRRRLGQQQQQNGVGGSVQYALLQLVRAWAHAWDDVVFGSSSSTALGVELVHAALTIDTAQNVGDFAAELNASFAQHVPRRERVCVQLQCYLHLVRNLERGAG